jgi:thiosulfate dehydrogenase [quinone] large subunit
MDTITKIAIIINIFAFLIILRELYIVSHHGKFIINTNKSRFWAIFSVIFWTGVSIVWCISAYLHYTQSDYIFSVLLAISWIEISISNIIRGLHSSEIRENGIYCSGNFYKWSKVQSYSWVLPTTIKFKVNTFFTTNYSFEFIIKEELKSKINETVQKYVL